MLYLIGGENTYARDQALQEVVDGHYTEAYDGAELAVESLPDIFAGQTLFSDQRTIVIRGLADNKTVWAALEPWLEKMPPETTVVLVEGKPDKRTKTYKQIQKNGHVREFSLPKNSRDAERLVLDEAMRRHLELAPTAARRVAERVGLDPWELVHALDKLFGLGESSPEAIEKVVDQTPQASAFDLFEAALRGETATVQRLLGHLAQREDGHRTFGLLSGQVLQLAALVTAPADASIAQAIGAHPFALSKLQSLAKKRSRADVRRIVGYFADADDRIKTGVEPWLAIESALQQTSGK